MIEVGHGCRAIQYVAQHGVMPARLAAASAIVAVSFSSKS